MTMETELDPQQIQEIIATTRAANQAALAHPAMMAAYLDPHWEVRAHTELISRALVDLANGDCRRLLVTTPPQIGKSSLIAEWFPFWWLARNPRHRVIVGSYGTSLANRRGRIVRRYIREHGWRWNLELEHGAQGVAEWHLSTGGGLKSVGVGSAVTGSPADCVTAATMILTEDGEIRADDLAVMNNPPRVASWNHIHARMEWQPVLAKRWRHAHVIREIRTENKTRLQVTPEHPVYVVGRGYIPAADVRRGDELLSAALPQPAALEQRRFAAAWPAPTPPRQDCQPPCPVRVSTWVTSNKRPRSNPKRVVYDFQVQQNRNFIADGILVHNCAIVDDPHKNRAEAESVIMRDAVWDWWSADIQSRLAPGAPVILVLTLWHCLTYNQTVSTIAGLTKVQDIKAGDYVLTSNGYQPVQATASRVHTGDSIRIRVYGNPEDLHVTPEHRVWTEQGWREAGDLKSGDWLLLPAPPRADAMSDEDLRALIPAPPGTRRKSNKKPQGTGEFAPLTKEQFEQHLADGLNYEQIANLYGRRSRQAAWSWAHHLGIKDRPAGNVINPECATDPEFWRLIGFWIAEGTITYGNKDYPASVCRWSFGAAEEHTHAAEIAKILNRYNVAAKCNIRGKGTKTRFHTGEEYREHKGTAVVTASSKQLAALLSEFGKGARNKHLPEWAFRLPNEHALALLSGWAEGDGCPMTGSNGFTQVTSSSFRLLRDFQLLLIRHGYKANITGSNGKSHPQLRFKLEGNNTTNRMRTDEHGMWVRVRTVEHEQYEGPVFDLQTPTGDFVAGGVLVHNCDDIAARVLEQDGREEEGGLWRVIRLPAFADKPDDPLGRAYWEPLPHPKIAEGDTETARRHWEDKRQHSLVRDWHALYMADPQPEEGALVSAAVMRARRHHPPTALPVRAGVAIDPSGGGRDLAGVIGGFLGDDGRLYVTRDSSCVGYSDTWALEAALMAMELEADFVIMEHNFGGDMAERTFDSAWDTALRLHRGEARDTDEPEHLRRAQAARPGHKPQVKLRHAKRGKLLRAEPIAQQWIDDRMRTGSYLPELESEWASWQPTDPDSPGRIDASCYLAYEMLPIPGHETVISTVTSLSRERVLWEHQRRAVGQNTQVLPQTQARIIRMPRRPGM